MAINASYVYYRFIGGRIEKIRIKDLEKFKDAEFIEQLMKYGSHQDKVTVYALKKEWF